jgi:DNA-binding GntR family transcriptional regulator
LVSIGAVLNAAEQVATILREEILTGELHGGAPVREQDVAERLGVSRTPVREAVGRLVAEGLLIKDGNKTAHVFRPTLADLLEIYEIRIPLESLAARLSCETADDTFVTKLEKARKALAKAEPGADWSMKHEAFHLLVARGSGRRRLESLVSTLRVQSEPYVRFAIASDGQFPVRAQHDHDEIVTFVRNRDGKGLERLVRNHLRATSKQVSTLLSRAAGAPNVKTVTTLPGGRAR